MSDWQKAEDGIRAKPEVCSIVVVYENTAARNLAIQYCDVLARKFMGEVEFAITWWRFDYLRDPDIAREAGLAAITADLILVGLDRDELPGEVRAWCDRWFPRRVAADGALALVRTSSEPDEGWAVDTYLRLAARRANLDYLAHTRSGSVARPDKLREDDVLPDTTRLYQTPDHPYHSSGWGINE